MSARGDTKRTYFLQLYFGLTPRAAQAFFSGLPALKSFFFPPYDKRVKRAVSDTSGRENTGAFVLGANPLVPDRVTKKARAAKVIVFIIFKFVRLLYLFSFGNWSAFDWRYINGRLQNSVNDCEERKGADAQVSVRFALYCTEARRKP